MCTIIPYSSNIITCDYKHPDDVFLSNLENVYQTESIYRGIIVTEVNRQKYMKDMLDMFNHTAYIIHCIDNIDYESLDNRLIIIDHTLFTKLLDEINKQCNLLYSSYNLIGISYDIQCEVKNKLLDYYYSLTKNNMNNTIII